jgi:hypothetical protein
MLGLIDRINLGRGLEALDDQSTSFRRKYGPGQSRVILFLPWNLSIETAERFCLLPRSYFACNETAPGIVSSTPQVPIDSLIATEKLFLGDLDAIRKTGREPLLIGMSMGNFPATYLANKYRLDLISIASGHSGDWLTFNSPAANHIRLKAEAMGLRESDFTALLGPVSPIHNLRSLGPKSQFIFGTFDRYIPKFSRDALIAQLAKERPDIAVTKFPFGHLATIFLWKFLARHYEDT